MGPQPQQTYLMPQEKRWQFDKFLQRNNQKFSFKMEFLKKILEGLLKKQDFKLPEPRKPEEVNKTGDPNFFPYHRQISHTLENC
ncbi:hypothetical protein, partial [Streptococcus anginosus]|uniref:hypothetical protein n=1 Tax=Streptococcus anginosus TaxID=1328 RepID=UPI002EDAB2B1